MKKQQLVQGSPYSPAARKRQRGQGLTEYAVIVSMIAVVGIGAVAYFGGKVNTAMQSVSANLENAESEAPKLQSGSGNAGGGGGGGGGKIGKISNALGSAMDMANNPSLKNLGKLGKSLPGLLK